MTGVAGVITLSVLSGFFSLVTREGSLSASSASKTSIIVELPAGPCFNLFPLVVAFASLIKSSTASIFIERSVSSCRIFSASRLSGDTPSSETVLLLDLSTPIVASPNSIVSEPLEVEANSPTSSALARRYMILFVSAVILAPAKRDSSGAPRRNTHGSDSRITGPLKGPSAPSPRTNPPTTAVVSASNAAEDDFVVASNSAHFSLAFSTARANSSGLRGIFNSVTSRASSSAFDASALPAGCGSEATVSFAAASSSPPSPDSASASSPDDPFNIIPRCGRLPHRPAPSDPIFSSPTTDALCDDFASSTRRAEGEVAAGGEKNPRDASRRPRKNRAVVQTGLRRRARILGGGPQPSRGGACVNIEMTLVIDAQD
mmetsp:Transcript_9301/g.28058  ORF Transcript_9301/g.28058 Transcript_9301/m.28058 type:complete len:374 (+) Transcript_9301:168-1289(+)